MFETVIATSVQLAPFVAGFVQVIKPTKLISKAYIKIASVIIGVILSLLFIGFSKFGGAVGFTSGLIATGAYEAVKKSVTSKINK